MYWGTGPQIAAVRSFARFGNLGPVPFFATHYRGGGSRVPWVGEFGGDVNGM